MADTRDESLDETAARLGLGAEPVAKMPVPPRNRRPGVPRLGGEHLAAGPPSRSARWGIIAAIAVGVIAIVVIAAVIISSVGGRGGIQFGANPWSEYPGTEYDDPREILAAPSLEEVTGRAEEFTAAFKAALGEEYGLLWQQEYEGDLRLTGNGYDGDSMLYDYSSPSWLGAAVVRDADARENIITVFQELSAEYGAEDFYIANDLYVESDDAETAISRFGSATRSKQALWSASADVYGLGGLDLNIDVFDSTIPTDKDFTGDYYSRVIELEDGDATLFITFRLSSYSLLSEDDRDEFTERIRQYDEDNKP